MSVRFFAKSWFYVAAAAVLAAVLIAGAISVRAQSQQPPYALFQNASLTGSGNTITASQVPVVTSPGVTVYENLTFQFNADGNGNLTLAPGFPQAILAPPTISSNFKAGIYLGPAVANGKELISVAGPGVTDGGATQWTLAVTSDGSSCTTPTSATWYVGPLASNPWASRIKAAGITSTAFSYGIASGPGCTFTGVNGSYWWSALIGVSQVQNTLTIASFTSQGSPDSSQPLAQITYTLQQ